MTATQETNNRKYNLWLLGECITTWLMGLPGSAPRGWDCREECGVARERSFQALGHHRSPASQLHQGWLLYVLKIRYTPPQNSLKTIKKNIYYKNTDNKLKSPELKSPLNEQARVCECMLMIMYVHTQKYTCTHS